MVRRVGATQAFPSDGLVLLFFLHMHSGEFTNIVIIVLHAAVAQHYGLHESEQHEVTKLEQIQQAPVGLLLHSKHSQPNCTTKQIIDSPKTALSLQIF